MKIALASIPVIDPLEAFEFYTRTLGFKKHTLIEAAQLAIVVAPDQPDGTALLLEPRGEAHTKTYQQHVYESGLPWIVLGVTDVTKEYERLTQLGVTFASEPTSTEWGTQAVFDDTCGNLVQLHQP